MRDAARVSRTVRRRVADFWDRHVRTWLSGADPMDAPLPEWFASFAGTGRGAVTATGSWSRISATCGAPAASPGW
jgi:hypothetical protein